VTQAGWLAGVLGRSKKIPPLKSFLITPAPKPKKSTWQELYAVGLAWASTAGEVISGGPA
jgi:hypothetical protein